MEVDDESEFFDARDDISTASDSCSSLDFLQNVFKDIHAAFKDLDSVEERRRRFMAWMRSNSTYDQEKTVDHSETIADRDREINSQDSSMTDQRYNSRIKIRRRFMYWVRSNSTEVQETTVEQGQILVLDQDLEIMGQDSSTDDQIKDLKDQETVGQGEMDGHDSSGTDQIKIMRREDNLSTSSTASTRRRRRKWLKRLGITACLINGDREEDDDHDDLMASVSSEEDVTVGIGLQRVKTRMSRKLSKEFSGVFSFQDIKAHRGAILAVRFSPDGRLLATGGEDGMVRVWAVGRESLGRGPYSELSRRFDCVVVPEEVCKISEEPLQEFVGHSGDILDLAWSKNNLLLSSSTDKTARLWRIGQYDPEKVFSHGNYVTCVQFDPEDDGLFVSGSIDGKVRVWEISSRQVVKWADVREIVTAVCFDPTGKEIVVGTISGRCLFYDSSDRRLQLVTFVPHHGKKKPGCNRITGFQFCPTDARKLLVSSADSQVRILEEHAVVSKFRGVRNSGSQIAASYTSDGRYVVSGSEDSQVYIWPAAPVNHCRRPWRLAGAAAPVACAHERFQSGKSYVAVPWPGPTPSPPLRSVSTSLFSEIFRGSAKRPDEKLPSPSPRGRAWRRRPKGCAEVAAGPLHAWGRVIVTAGWDGRMRTFHNYGLPVPA